LNRHASGEPGWHAYTILKDYVRGELLRGREMFVPLTPAPIEAQGNFDEAL
jgi:hypothetical protein